MSVKGEMSREISRRGRGKEQGIEGVIMKPTKYCLKRGREGKYVDRIVQSALLTCMKLSQ
jgi:hypothetical protein